MKIAIITDTHWGVRNDNVIFLNNNKLFLDNIFFPTLEKHSIKQIIHLGDLVDRRKYVNINTVNRLRNDFLQRVSDQYEMDVTAGNHDVYYKNTNDINFLDEFIGNKYPNINVYTNPIEREYGGIKILLLPWITSENRTETIDLIGKTNAQICMGHLELEGFQMYKGSQISHGEDRGIFRRFDVVFSGHYHHRSTLDNIHYLGSHGEFTWSDYNDPRGFHIFETETRELEFIENPYTLFKKIWYNDDKNILERTDFASIKDCFIKVIVQSKENPYNFDTFMNKIYEAQPAECSIVEDHKNMDSINEEELLNEAEDTLTILSKYVNNLETSVDNKQLDLLLRDLYNEALRMETT